MRRCSWLATAGALALSLVLSSCATERTVTTVNPHAPKPAATPKMPKRSLFSQAMGGFGLSKLIFPRKKKNEVPKALPAHMIGTVKLVNKDERFVLIDTVSFSSSPPGTPLLCIMNETQTATLKLSPLHNPPFIIADIVNGEPSPGDRVYQP